jgi:hypothetical protein
MEKYILVEHEREEYGVEGSSSRCLQSLACTVLAKLARASKHTRYFSPHFLCQCSRSSQLCVLTGVPPGYKMSISALAFLSLKSD